MFVSDFLMLTGTTKMQNKNQTETIQIQTKGNKTNRNKTKQHETKN